MREQSIVYEINVPVISGSAVVMIDGEAKVIRENDFITCEVKFTVKSRWPWHIKKIDAEPTIRKVNDASVIQVMYPPPTPLNPDRI